MIASFAKTHRAQLICLLFLFAFSLVCSSLYLSFFKNIGPAEHQIPGTDYFIRYEPLARSLLEGRGLELAQDGQVTSTPGYPLILLLLFGIGQLTGVRDLTLIIIANVFMTALSVCVLFLIAKEIVGRNVALLAGFLWSFYPLNLWLIKNPNTEVPFILLFYIGLWLYTKSVKHQSVKHMVTAGLLIGFALLIRPFGLLLPLLFIALLWVLVPTQKLERAKLARVRVRLAIAFAVGALLTTGPWIWYASARTSHFVPLSSLGPTAISVGLSYAFVGNGQHQYEVSPDVRLLMQRVRNTSFTTTKDIAFFFVNEFVSQPLVVIKLLTLKVVRSWYATYGMWWEKQIALLQIAYLVTAVAGIIIALRKFRYRPHYAWLWALLAFILYFWAMTFVSLSIVRYMLPMMGFVMIFVALALNNVLARFNVVPEKIIMKFTNYFSPL